jgi:hypothetical protein
MDTETRRLFDRWVIVPFAALRQLPNGDGAFAALAMGFGLYERFITSSIHSRGGDIDKERYTEGSSDFDRAVSADDFKAFWEMYRIGVQHYFHPKHFTKSKDGTRWGWDISEQKGYAAFPKVTQPESDLFIITIDPWAFVEHTIRRWHEHPELLDELSATKFAKIESAKTAAAAPQVVTSPSCTPGETFAPLAQSHGTGICPPIP